MISNLNRFQVSFGYNFRWIKQCSKFIFFMHMLMQDHDSMPVLYVLTKRESLPNIVSVRIVGGKSHSSLWLVLAVWLTQTWLAYLQKTHVYMTYITTYSQVVPVHLALHGQRCIRYENVFTSWVRNHKTFLGRHILGAQSWLVTC
jgi:hypothetical protein